MRVAGELPLALSLAVGDSSGGVVRRIPRGELAMDVTAHQFPVDLLEPLLDPAVVNKLEGRLTVDAHARGDIESPALSGRIALAGAKIRIPPLGATYEKGTVDATLEGTTVRLTRARIESGDGRLEASGTIHVQGSPVAGFDLQSTLDDFQLADGEELRSTASGTLRLRGTAMAPALAGAVRLRKTEYYLQAKSLEQGAEPVELTAADLRVVERRFGVAVDWPAGGQSSRWALDLDVGWPEKWAPPAYQPVHRSGAGGQGRGSEGARRERPGLRGHPATARSELRAADGETVRCEGRGGRCGRADSTAPRSRCIPSIAPTRGAAPTRRAW